MDSKELKLAQTILGETVRKYRLKAGLSQEKLADKVGVHRNYIGDIERAEENISLINMLKLADALGITIQVLVHNIGKPKGQ